MVRKYQAFIHLHRFVADINKETKNNVQKYFNKGLYTTSGDKKQINL